MIKGIDISHHQNDKGAIDFERVKMAGYQFVFIKATQGRSYVDTHYKKNRDAVRKAGLLLGHYHFAGDLLGSGEIIARDPVIEADHFLKNVSDIRPGEILILDWEINHATPAKWCRTFLDRVKEKTGVKALFYTYESRLKQGGWESIFKGDNGLWIAKYNSNDGTIGAEPVTKPWPYYALWQYSSNGKVAGIIGPVDVNLANMTLENLKKYGFEGGEPEPTPSPTPETGAFHRYGHCKELFVKVGDKVKKGQKIGTIGKGGPNNFSAHLHYDIPKNELNDWTSFVIGKSKAWVAENHIDPNPYKLIVLPNFSHLGLGYLEFWQYPGGPAYHPGLDLNSEAGDGDLGDDFYSATDGEVIYAYNENGSNNGWGKLLVIKETSSSGEESLTPTKKLASEYKELLGKDCGEKMNANEQDNFADAIKDLRESAKIAKEPVMVVREVPIENFSLAGLAKLRFKELFNLK